MTGKKLGLFEAFGVELEYMIVGRDSLDVLPVTDEVLRAVAGEYVSDLERDGIGWSNELVLHVMELKTPTPAATLNNLASRFQENVREINGILEGMGGRLMPTAMHPWMDPQAEMRLWPHEHSAIYEAYNRIFCCQGHGWANLQSVHLNLPFANDAEFERLHAAIRVLLPIIPAIAASSPIYESRASGFVDTRMEVYRVNQQRIPSLTGHVIPERVFSEQAYREQIFERMFRDIAPHDPGEILRDEFLNSRGAIARFGRGSIEIRVIDIQECPQADLALLSIIIAALRALVGEEWTDCEIQKEWPEERLREIFLDCVRHGEHAVIRDAEYLELFGITPGADVAAQELWQHIDDELFGSEATDEFAATRRFILDNGSLSRRILSAVQPIVNRDSLRPVYERLCDCLAEGILFRG